MRFNPFRPGAPVQPGMFAGRVAEIGKLEKALFQTKHGGPQHVLITGERGIGKSSLLLYLDAVRDGAIPIDDKGETVKFAALRFEPDSNDSFEDLLKRLAQSLKKLDAEIHGVKAKALKVLAFLQRVEAHGFKLAGAPSSGSDIELDDFADGVIEFIENLEGYDGLLLIVDEADRAERCDFGRFCKMLTERIERSKQNRFGIILAGLPAVTDVLQRSHESSLRIFERIELAPLKEEDRKAVVEAGLRVAEKKGDPVTIHPDALSEISKISDGYPQFIQQFAHSAFEATEDNVIDISDFKKGFPNAIEQLAAKYFKGPVLQEIFSDDYRKVLAAFSESGDGWVTKNEIRERAGLKESQVTNALATLKDKQLILPKDGQRGMYRLPSKAFALWIMVALKAPPTATT